MRDWIRQLEGVPLSPATGAGVVGLVGAVCATLVIFGAVGSVGAATATSDHPTVRLTDGNATVGVVLTSAPDGLAGYCFDLSVDSPDEGRIVDASYPAKFGLTSAPEYSDGGERVTLEAVDLHDAVQPGATGIRLATVTVENADPDALDLAVEPRQFDADDGSGIEPDLDDGNGESTDSEEGGGPAGEESNGGSAGAGSSDSASSDTTVDDSGDGDGGDTGGRETTPDSQSSQGTPTTAAPATGVGGQPTTVAAGTDDSATASDTAVSSGDTGGESVEPSSLSPVPLAVVGLVVALVLGFVRLRGRDGP